MISYYGMLRIGEVSTGDHPIKATDVHIGQNKQKLMIILQTSKTHNLFDKPQIIKISAIERLRDVGDQKMLTIGSCLFNLVRKYLEIRPNCPSEHELLFIFRDGSDVKPVHLRNMLQQLTQSLGLNHTLYSFHGFRGGCATDLYEMGVSVETLKKLGRWKSNAVYTYLR